MTTQTELTFDPEIVQRVRDELVHARETAWEKRRELDPEAATLVQPTIRLGTDYVRAPLVLQPSAIPFVVKYQRNKLGNRAWDAIELGIESLAGYFSKIQLEDFNLGYFRSGDSLDSIIESLNTGTRKCTWLSYLLGTNHGREEGQLVLKTILGDLPTCSKMYACEPYQEDSLAQVHPGVVRVKVKIETPDMREDKHSSLLDKNGKCLELVEAGVKKAVDLRVQMIVYESGTDETPQSRLQQELLGRHLQNELCSIRQHILNAIYCSYDIGKFDGFEQGQNSMKDTYKDLDCHCDAKIYSFATTLMDGNGTTVDLYSPVKCGCGQCIYCIRDNTTRYEDQWPGRFQSAKDTIDRVETELAEERRRKRQRRTL